MKINESLLLATALILSSCSSVPEGKDNTSDYKQSIRDTIAKNHHDQ